MCGVNYFSLSVSGSFACCGGLRTKRSGFSSQAAVKNSRAIVDDIGGEPTVNLVRRQDYNAAVVMFHVVPVEEFPAMGAGVGQRTKAVGEFGPVLYGRQMIFGKRIVVGDLGPAVGPGHAEISEHKGHELALHGGPIVGMNV